MYEGLADANTDYLLTYQNTLTWVKIVSESYLGYVWLRLTTSGSVYYMLCYV